MKTRLDSHGSADDVVGTIGKICGKAIKTIESTPVIFRTFISGGDVIALFPFEPSDNYGHHCMSYQHVGQHGGATPDLMRGNYTRAAQSNEVAPLKAELEQIGYSVKELKRFPRNAFDVRKQKASQPSQHSQGE